MCAQTCDIVYTRPRQTAYGAVARRCGYVIPEAARPAMRLQVWGHTCSRIAVALPGPELRPATQAQGALVARRAGHAEPPPVAQPQTMATGPSVRPPPLRCMCDRGGLRRRGDRCRSCDHLRFAACATVAVCAGHGYRCRACDRLRPAACATVAVCADHGYRAVRAVAGGTRVTRSGGMACRACADCDGHTAPIPPSYAAEAGHLSHAPGRPAVPLSSRNPIGGTYIYVYICARSPTPRWQIGA
jgi:hypothetical protein